MNEDALKNQGLRNEIILSEEVSSLYHLYILEDGSIIAIDRHYASQLVRQFFKWSKEKEEGLFQKNMQRMIL